MFVVKIMQNRFISPLLWLIVLFLIHGCHHEKKPQRDLALKVADYIKSDLANTNYSYNYQIICNSSVKGIVSPEYPKSRDQVVPKAVKNSIRDHSKEDCNAAPSEFASFLYLVEQSLEKNQGNVILILQFPWGNIKDEQIEMIAKQFDALKEKKKIEKVLIFGLQGESPKTMRIFRALPEVLNSEGLDQEAVHLAINNLSSNIKKGSSSKKYTILTLFIPIENK